MDKLKAKHLSWCTLPALGLVITACYLLGATWLLFDRVEQLKTMPLNEIGDFLAGIFGALAFFWLVIGYFMQNSELKLNRKSLEKQIEEFEKSVSSQIAHHELIKDKEQNEKSIKQFKAKPIFSFKNIYHAEILDFTRESFSNLDPEYNTVSFQLRNDGGTIFNIKSEISAEAPITNTTLTSLQTGEWHPINLESKTIPSIIKLKISYDTEIGERFSKCFKLCALNDEHNTPDQTNLSHGGYKIESYMTVTTIEGLVDGN